MVERRREPVSVAIFAKAPIEGYAKTRLIPRLGEKGAADLQRQLIERTVQVACAADVGPVSLWCSPAKSEPAFQSLSERYGLCLFDQAEGDLGSRMHHVFSAKTVTMPAILVGTDCAVIAPGHLAACARALKTGVDAVFIPVEDGGYILVGLRRPSPGLFQSIPWGTSHVMVETRKRAKALNISLSELPPLWDIDLPQDYERAVTSGALAFHSEAGVTNLSPRAGPS